MKKLLTLGFVLLFSISVSMAAPPNNSGNIESLSRIEKLLEQIKQLKTKLKELKKINKEYQKGAGGSVPIDGGLGILMASGIAFGAHKYRKNRRAG